MLNHVMLLGALLWVLCFVNDMRNIPQDYLIMLWTLCSYVMFLVHPLLSCTEYIQVTEPLNCQLFDEYTLCMYGMRSLGQQPSALWQLSGYGRSSASTILSILCYNRHFYLSVDLVDI